MSYAPTVGSIHTYIHAFIHTYIHAFIHAYIHAFIHTYIDVKVVHDVPKIKGKTIPHLRTRTYIKVARLTCGMNKEAIL